MMMLSSLVVPLIFFIVLGNYTSIRKTEQDKEAAWEQADTLLRMALLKLSGVSEEERRDFLDKVKRRPPCFMGMFDSTGRTIEDLGLGPWKADEMKRWIGQGRVVIRKADRLYALAVRPLPEPDRDLYVAVAVPMSIGRWSPPEGARWLFLAALALLIASMVVARSVGEGVRSDIRNIISTTERMMRMGKETVVRFPEAAFRDEIGRLSARLESIRGRFNEELSKYEKALADLENDDRYKEEFLSTVSHELRTPLNAIIGFADLLLQNIDGELTPTQREDVRIIRQSGLHLLGMIEEILDISAITSGHLKLEIEDVDLALVSREVLEAARPQVQGKPVDLVLDIEPGIAVVRADRRRVWQVMTNLVGNAVKFTDQGEIRVSAEKNPGEVLWSVRDTGAGIAPEDLEHIFMEFEQRGDIQVRRRGTGLGLAISRRLVTLHGGRIWAESSPGEGATFHFTMPSEGP